jgi:glycogen(starch) synthase
MQRDLTISRTVSLQYYRQARMKALQKVYSDLDMDDDASVERFNYPRPISEPPSPSSSRHTTPAASRHGSDDEDEVDDEKEVIIG